MTIEKILMVFWRICFISLTTLTIWVFILVVGLAITEYQNFQQEIPAEKTTIERGLE